jgi:hypothetical protein
MEGGLATESSISNASPLTAGLPSPTLPVLNVQPCVLKLRTPAELKPHGTFASFRKILLYQQCGNSRACTTGSPDRAKLHKQVGELIDRLSTDPPEEVLKKLASLAHKGTDSRSICGPSLTLAQIPPCGTSSGSKVEYRSCCPTSHRTTSWPSSARRRVCCRTSFFQVPFVSPLILSLSFESDSANQEAVRLFAGIPEILNALVKTGSNTGQECLGTSLTFIAMRDSANQAAIREAGGIPMLISVLSSGAQPKVSH